MGVDIWVPRGLPIVLINKPSATATIKKLEVEASSHDLSGACVHDIFTINLPNLVLVFEVESEKQIDFINKISKSCKSNAISLNVLMGRIASTLKKEHCESFIEGILKSGSEEQIVVIGFNYLPHNNRLHRFESLRDVEFNKDQKLKLWNIIKKHI